MRQFSWAPDIAHITARLALERIGVNATYNLGSSTRRTVAELAKHIRSIVPTHSGFSAIVPLETNVMGEQVPPPQRHENWKILSTPYGNIL